MRYSRWLTAVFLFAFVSVAIAQADGSQIRLASRTFTPEPIERIDVALAEFAGGHALIQLHATPNAAGREALREAGVVLLSPLSGTVWLARIDDRRFVADEAVRAVRWVGAILESDKVSADLARGRLYSFAVETDGRRVFDIGMHRDVSEAAGRSLIEAAGGTVVDYGRFTNSFVAAMETQSALGLAASDLVLSVGQPGPALTPVLDEARPAVGADEAAEDPYWVTGAGVTAFVLDGGTMAEGNAGHPDLAGRVVVEGLPIPDIIGHPTHVGCIIGGSGYMSNGLYTGMAPAVQIVSSCIIPSLTIPPLYNAPGNMESAYGKAIDGHGATVSNNSIGSNLAQFGTQYCDKEGDYERTAQTVDGIAYANAHRLTIVWSNGNERGYADPGCGDSYFTTAPPATAKNSLAVGATNKDDDSMTSFSSWGPTDDGRVRPDISAPGCARDGSMIISCTGPFNEGDYQGMCGTSMAGPAAAGSVALIQEYWRRQTGTEPRGDTMKALAIHGATPEGNDGPDYEYGYGIINVPNSLDLIDQAYIAEESVDQGEELRLTLESGGGAVKVTLVWIDPPGETLAPWTLVNDLDLFVETEQGTVLPWTLDPAVPDQAATRAENHRDPVEQVEFDGASLTQTVDVVVRGTSVPTGPQAFSLIVEGLVEPQADDDDTVDDDDDDSATDDDDDDDDDGCGC